jgi:hypothetical protein
MKLRKFRALVGEKGLDDFGESGLTFKVDQLVKGKVYTQADLTRYGLSGTADFFVDSNGCSRDINYMINSGKIEEIFE